MCKIIYALKNDRKNQHVHIFFIIHFKLVFFYFELKFLFKFFNL